MHTAVLRYGWRGLCPVLLLVAAFLGCSAPEPTAPPNVVLIVVDALRADHLSHYGYHRDTARGLDVFAAQATIFTDCSAPASWTNPSVASLMTGLHPARHRAHELGAVLQPELNTLAEILKAAGFTTAAVSFNPGIRSELGYDRGFDRFDEHLGRSTHYPDISEMVSRVSAWLDEAPQRPFFLYLHPMNVHGPYRVPETHRDVLLGRPPGREFRYYGEPMQGILRRGDVDLRQDVSEAYVASLIDSYDTAIRYTTDQLEMVFGLLETAGVYDESLIIVTADHGEELFDHGGFSHGYSLHHEVLHVPLYVKLPFQSEGRRVEEPATLMDLLPTILALTGAGAAGEVDGRLLESLVGEAADATGDAPFRLYQTARPNRCVARAIAGERYKLIEIASNYEGLTDAVRLYDLDGDPLELEDLAAVRPELTRELRGDLVRRFEALDRRAVEQPANRLEDLDQERLRALGYLE